MPTKVPPKPPARHADPDPEHDFDWGGDAQQDDADVKHDGGQKGGRDHRESEGRPKAPRPR